MLCNLMLKRRGLSISSSIFGRIVSRVTILLHSSKFWLNVKQYIACSLTLILYEPWRPKGFIQFEIIINVLVSFFWLIWIRMLWVYGHYKYYQSYSAATDFRRQKLASTDFRFWRLKSVPALWRLRLYRIHIRDHWCKSCIRFAVERRNGCTQLSIRPFT